jgi:hypothetical protein
VLYDELIDENEFPDNLLIQKKDYLDTLANIIGHYAQNLNSDNEYVDENEQKHNIPNREQLEKYGKVRGFLKQYTRVEYFNDNYTNEINALHLHGNSNKDVLNIDLKRFLKLFNDVYEIMRDVETGVDYIKNNVKVTKFWKYYKSLKEMRSILNHTGFDSKPLGAFFATFEKNIGNLFCEFLMFKAKSNALNNVKDSILSDALHILRLSKLAE